MQKQETLPFVKRGQILIPAKDVPRRSAPWNVGTSLGTVGWTKALTVSCNPYFYQLTQRTSGEAFLQTLSELGLFVRDLDLGLLHRGSVAQLLIGLDPDFKLIPLQVLQAYVALLNGRTPRENQKISQGGWSEVRQLCRV